MVTLGHLLDILEGPWDLVECESFDEHGRAVCSIRVACPSRTFMFGINRAVKGAFEQVTLGDQADQRQADSIVLALDDLLDVADDAFEAIGERLDGPGDSPLPCHCESGSPWGRGLPEKATDYWSVEVVLALDVGGTKLAAGLVTAEGELVASASKPGSSRT